MEYRDSIHSVVLWTAVYLSSPSAQTDQVHRLTDDLAYSVVPNTHVYTGPRRVARARARYPYAWESTGQLSLLLARCSVQLHAFVISLLDEMLCHEGTIVSIGEEGGV